MDEIQYEPDNIRKRFTSREKPTFFTGLIIRISAGRIKTVREANVVLLIIAAGFFLFAITYAIFVGGGEFDNVENPHLKVSEEALRHR